MKYSYKKGIITKAWRWRLITREVSRIVGRTFRIQYIRDVASGQRDAPAITFHLRLAIDNIDAELSKQKLRVVDGRRGMNK